MHTGRIYVTLFCNPRGGAVEYRAGATTRRTAAGNAEHNGTDLCELKRLPRASQTTPYVKLILRDRTWIEWTIKHALGLAGGRTVPNICTCAQPAYEARIELSRCLLDSFTPRREGFYAWLPFFTQSFVTMPGRAWEELINCTILCNSTATQRRSRGTAGALLPNCLQACKLHRGRSRCSPTTALKHAAQMPRHHLRIPEAGTCDRFETAWSPSASQICLPLELPARTTHTGTAAQRVDA